MQTAIEFDKPKTQKQKVLDKLKQAGMWGVNSRDLNAICFRYSARIEDLRKEGYNITTEQVKKGLFKYTLWLRAGQQ